MSARAGSSHGHSASTSSCEQDETGCHIWQAVRSGDTWSTTQLTSGAGEEGLPDTNGQIVVYSSTRTENSVTDSDIYWQPLGGGAEQRLALPGEQVDPHVSGRLISFESGSPNAHGRAHVVWAVKNADWDVQGTSFRLPPTSLALAPADSSQDVGTRAR